MLTVERESERERERERKKKEGNENEAFERENWFLKWASDLGFSMRVEG